MTKIMNALEWLTEIHGFENLVKEDANLVEEYHEYRKSIEVCENCEHIIMGDGIPYCHELGEYTGVKFGCNSWQEKQQ